MKRFAIKDYGVAKDVFETIEALPREVDDTHVRIQIKAFAINPYDISVRQGAMREFQSLKFPYVLGKDGAGIVTEVGSKVAGINVGDAVLFHALTGAYGEEIVVPGKKVFPKPAQMSFATAASIVTPGITAYNLIFQLLKKTGDTIAVQGASGAVGSLLVQLLKEQGKKVLGTASSKNEAYVRKLGVDEFAPYDQVNPGEVFAHQADVVIDATKGSRSAASGMAILKPGGTYVALNDLPQKRSTAGEYVHFGPKKEYDDAVAIAYLTELFAKGKLTVQIAEQLPFELSSVIAAHEKIEGHPSAGKIIIERT